MTSGYPEATAPLGRQADTLYQEGIAAYNQRQYRQARQLLEQSLPLFRDDQHTPGVLRVLHVLANIAHCNRRLKHQHLSPGRSDMVSATLRTNER